MNLCNKELLEADHLIIRLPENSKIINITAEDEGGIKLKDIVEICEKEAIIKALKKNKTCRKAAKALGVSHTTIINKINKYNIKWNE
ncbi:hypothetical protein SDC9_129058 [bioreactor metagenome]|uniref:TyrR-like helix-turn-helix domain-containing protein n=2 Tax=root TaxID=1 RepID=A0A645CXS3_9ZZZZ